jgi:hypothetical protein
MPPRTPPQTPATDALDAVECYRFIRDQIEHEDNLMTQRLNWFLASQSFLFTAYGIVLNAPAESRFGAAHHSTYLHLLPLLGLTVGVLIWIGVLAGIVQMGRLRATAVACRCVAPAGLPAIQGAASARALGQAAPTLAPPLFITAWCILLFAAHA